MGRREDHPFNFSYDTLRKVGLEERYLESTEFTGIGLSHIASFLSPALKNVVDLYAVIISYRSQQALKPYIIVISLMFIKIRFRTAVVKIGGDYPLTQRTTIQLVYTSRLTCKQAVILL